MTSVQMLQGALQALPRNVRKTLYSALVLLGAGLSACAAAGITDLGPVSVTRALQIFAALSPAAGVVAVANVGKPDQGYVVTDEEDVDLSAFEPIGPAEDVYGVPGN
ncbi:hypothetical protein [Nocardioides sp.]|uniref:hypothetical protein n=1 Tax=Nocardioides sp. TaxID=35761 RepID=UPI0035622EBC